MGVPERARSYPDMLRIILIEGLSAREDIDGRFQLRKDSMVLVTNTWLEVSNLFAGTER